MNRAIRCSLLLALVAVAGCRLQESPPPPPPATPQPNAAADRAAVDSVLTALHQTASAADWDTYFGLYDSNAVFFGTDATERWSLEQFRGYASASRGWTYRMTERNIFLDAGGNTAWFDERLYNDGYGECRGTGVLVKTATGWKIAQYNLTFPIPNDLAGEFTAKIKARSGGS
ncbi:MAG TPA: nuclear transport factor 2 family protein [Gemmatimonadales bacterium]|mgnify:CR=1 FL=1|nr:nuclear transport factor 2 family protein [Gemmatimonadales bacterium]